MLAVGRLIIHERDVAWVTRSIFRILHPLNFSEMAEDRIVKLYARVGAKVGLLVLWWQTVPKWAWSRSREVLTFGKWVLISRKRCMTEIYLQWKTNKKSYMSYQMAATTVTLNDLEGHPQVAGFFKRNPSNMWLCVQHFTRFQLTVCWRSLCVSWASCMNRETTDKWLLYARNTESG